MIFTSICCWTVIILGIILLIYGIYRDIKHRKMYKEIQKNTMFKSRMGLFGPYITAKMAGYVIRYQVEQRLMGASGGWITKITITHPQKLFPVNIDRTNPDTMRALSIIRPDSVDIQKNKKLIIKINEKPEHNEEILQLIQASILLAKSIDCA